jgi:hypothetical protein
MNSGIRGRNRVAKGAVRAILGCVAAFGLACTPPSAGDFCNSVALGKPPPRAPATPSGAGGPCQSTSECSDGTCGGIGPVITLEGCLAAEQDGGTANSGVCADYPNLSLIPAYGDDYNSECCLFLENGNVVGLYLSPD